MTLIADSLSFQVTRQIYDILGWWMEFLSEDLSQEFSELEVSKEQMGGSFVL